MLLLPFLPLFFHMALADVSTKANSTTGHINISTACPGAAYFMEQNNTESTFLNINMSACNYGKPPFPANMGVVYGVCGASTVFCYMRMEVKREMYVRLHVRRLAYWCGGTDWNMTIFMLPVNVENLRIKCDVHSLQKMFMTSFNHFFRTANLNNPKAMIDIQAIKNNDELVLQYVTTYSGYMFVPYVTRSTAFEKTLNAHCNCVIMVNVLQSRRPETCSESSTFKVTYIERNTSQEYTAHVCAERSTPASTFLTSFIRIQIMNYLQTFMKLRFYSFFENDRPQNVQGGLFNCSVSHYFKFQQFVHCNLKTECEDGRDETGDCPFSSPECQGMVASRDKCYKMIVLDSISALRYVGFKCLKMGQRMASVKSRQEQNDALHILRNYVIFNVIIGYSSGWHLVPFMYGKLRRWFDKTIIYNLDHFSYCHPDRRFTYCRPYVYNPSRISKHGDWTAYGLRDLHELFGRYAILCEMELQLLDMFLSQVVFTYIQSSLSNFRNTQQNLLICSDSPMTHSFIHCNPNGHCLETNYSQPFDFQNADDERNERFAIFRRRNTRCAHAMFRCKDDSTLLHYTLVCDFRQDCPDNNDETFCEHPPCYGFLCHNGQCVSFSQRCNEYSDCVDDSDEVDCQQQNPKPCTYCIQDIDGEKKQHFYINLDGTGYFTQQSMKTEEPCPDTHYRCTSEWLYCLPVYTRCNGFSDCVYGEDERNCDSVRCLNLYQCQTSTVCVHEDHLCDGWGQCPQRDDEMLCDMTCPTGCLCQGHSFLCRNTFPPDTYLQLRYVDATGSGMSLCDFTLNAHLVYLDLSSCSMSNISGIKLPNLQFIDLMDNNLTSLDMSDFLQLANLRVLLLARNPLRSHSGGKSRKQVHRSLIRLDISRTNFNAVNNELLVYLPMTKYFNLSFSEIKLIGSIGFKSMRRLVEVDIRFNPIDEFPLALFLGSKHLQNILVPNHRFCCESVLPKQPGMMKCLAPYSILPSCAKLMPTELYRVFFWLVSVCATLGSVSCIVNVLVCKGVFEGNLVMIANFLCAKLCTGLHVTFVVAANEMLNVPYIQFEKAWTSSVICKIAGFLFYLSCETSVLILGFITLDHVIVICFRKTALTVKEVSLTQVCIVVWCVGILFSFIPFLPGLSHWRLHVQSGLCRLALFDRYDSAQEFRWLTVIVAMNFMMCLIIVVSQLIIYNQMPKFRVTLDPTRRSVYSSVHLMQTIATMDNVTWLSFGSVTIMTLFSRPLMNKIHDTMIVFVLPLSSAFDPFLYFLSLVQQRRQHMSEQKVLKVLKSRLVVLGKQTM